MKLSKGWFLKMSLVNKTVKQKAGLTSRQKAIIEILTKFTATKPVTIAAISQKLKLSSRTILREMPYIEKWLSENEFKFIRKPGVGLVLDESIENQKLILELLEIEHVEKEYSKEERQRLILGELLATKEPLKSYYFTSKFKISDGTLSNDLDAIEKYLKPFRIKTVRKQGLGVFLQGKENDIRQAIANVLYDSLEEKEIIELISGKTNQKSSQIEVAIQNRLLNFIDLETIQTIESVLLHAETKLKIKYTDSAYIGLIVHLSLAIKRIQNNENIIMDKFALSELKILPEFSIAQEIAKSLEEAFDISIPSDEIGYITMHLKGAKLRLNRLSGEINIANINIMQVTNHIVSKVGQELGVSFKGNTTLIEDLSNHLVPAISRLSMKLNIKNTQLDVIKENYTTVFYAAQKACSILKEITKAEEIPESEIAYIAMHFCAALERNRTKEDKLAVVIVCPTGVGTSKLLAVNVSKEFHNLEVRAVISALNIDTKNLEENGIDFIISTIELTVEYPYICVNPFLLEQDKLLLKSMIFELKQNNWGKQKNKKIVIKKRNFDKEEISYITLLGEEIIFLLNHIKLYELQKVQDFSQMISEAGKVFAETIEQQTAIVNAFMQREQIASTYIEEFKMYLLHCKCNLFDHCYFGIIRLKQPLLEQKKEVYGGIIMIVPDSINSIYTKIMSEISNALIESSLFLQAVLHKRQDYIVKEVERRLCNYYMHTMKKRMGMLKND